MIDLDRLFDISGADSIAFEPRASEGNLGDGHVVHFEYWLGPGKTSTFITLCDGNQDSADYAARKARESREHELPNV